MITGLDSQPDESLLPSDKDVQLLGQEYEDGDHSVSLNDYILQAQLAKDEARHEADKVKVREQTLKEVGEWLDNKTHHQAKLFGIDDKYYVIVADGDIKTIQEGRMP